MTAPALARFAADLDAACETSRELTALWGEVLDAHRAARAESRRAVYARHTITEETRRG